MPPFGSDKKFDSLYTPKEPTLSGSSTSKPRGSTSSRDVGKYNLSNPFLKKPSNPLIFGYGNSAEVDLTTDSSKNKTVIGQSANINQSTIEQIKQDSKENLSPDITKSATAPEKVVEDVIKKINKAEASYNYIPPSFEIFLLQNSKNKVLFNFIRPTFSYNLKLVSPADQSTLPQFSGQDTNYSGLDENPNLIPLDQTKIKQIDISNFSLLFYKTKNKPSSIEEITSEANLFKELTPAKKELSIIDFLDVNTDYYFYVIPEQNLIDKISSLIVTEFDLSLGDFKVTTAGEKGILSDYVYRIKVIKDGELYFLEKEAINLKEIKDTKKTKSFFGTFLVEPKYNFVSSTIKNFAQKNAVLPFTTSDSVFDSGDNYPYIKFRFKSKKSNRKVDINLKYTILNSDPVKLNEQQISQDKVGKYTKLTEFYPPEQIKPILYLTKETLNKFLDSKDSRYTRQILVNNLILAVFTISKIAKVIENNGLITIYGLSEEQKSKLDKIIENPIIKKFLSNFSSVEEVTNPSKMEGGIYRLKQDKIIEYVKQTADSQVDPRIRISDFFNLVTNNIPNAQVYMLEQGSSNKSLLNFDSFQDKEYVIRVFTKEDEDKLINLNQVSSFEFQKIFSFLEKESIIPDNIKSINYYIEEFKIKNFLESKNSLNPSLYENFKIFLQDYYSNFFANDSSKQLIFNENNPIVKFFNFEKENLNNVDQILDTQYGSIYSDDIQIYKNLLNLFVSGKEKVGDAILQL